jgi:hypothetical protein
MDATKFFNPETALEQAEKHAKSCTGFIPNTKVRDLVETINLAGFEFARAQVAAARELETALKKAWQI